MCTYKPFTNGRSFSSCMQFLHSCARFIVGFSLQLARRAYLDVLRSRWNLLTLPPLVWFPLPPPLCFLSFYCSLRHEQYVWKRLKNRFFPPAEFWLLIIQEMYLRTCRNTQLLSIWNFLQWNTQILLTHTRLHLLACYRINCSLKEWARKHINSRNCLNCCL